jgi:AcrR family transcriptional regulator
MTYKKNRDETMKRLIAAVGEILTEKGYTGLGINKVALHAGVSKELIYRYFDSMNNLLKTYINGKDYWLPVLAHLNKNVLTNGGDAKQLFTGLMKEQFFFFYEEPEMQKFILWQISESNIVMRSISDRRESEGAKLLALTDDHFKGSQINVRAIIALLLGGIYYVVLHASSNKSTVAGIDVNSEQDRQEVVKAIEQILSWAWQAAAEQKK